MNCHADGKTRMAGQVMQCRWEDKALTLGWEDKDGPPQPVVPLEG